jgi:hypothetical protein
MDSVYGDEKSNLRIKKVLLEFPLQHATRFAKRIFYSYFLRDFNAASLQLVCGLGLLLSGLVFGASRWAHYSQLNIPAPTGTVLLATVQVILGAQFLLSWITYDVNCNPTQPISSRLKIPKRRAMLPSSEPANAFDRAHGA